MPNYTLVLPHYERQELTRVHVSRFDENVLQNFRMASSDVVFLDTYQGEDDRVATINPVVEDSVLGDSPQSAR